MPEISISRVKLAENLVEGVQYLSKRGVLAEISANNPSFSLTCLSPQYSNSAVEWLKVEQVGICHEYTSHQFYSVIQKALFSCHQPGNVQIIFMIYGDGEKVNLYIGIKQIDESAALGLDNGFAENLTTYLNKLLPGSKTRFIQDLDASCTQIIENIEAKEYRHLYALTGIPSFLP